MAESEQRILSTHKRAGVMTIGEMFDRYLAGVYPDWWEKDVGRVKKELIGLLGDIAVDEITRQMAQDFQRHLRTRLAPATCDRKLAIARAVWNESLDKAKNPFALVEAFHPDNRLTRHLSDEEEAKLIEVARHSGVPGQIVEMALCTGMRYSEIVMLRWDQVNWDAGLLEFRQKGSRPAFTIINRCVKRILDEADTSGPYCFPSPLTGKPLVSMERSWRTMKKKAGIDRPFRFHDLRHHVAIKIIRKGGGLTGAQAILHHSDPSMTMRYAAFLPDYLREISELLDS